MYKFFFQILVLIIGFLINGCSDFKKNIGLEKNIPDEFLVEKRESLSLPPEYKIIPPDSKNKEQLKDKEDNSIKIIVDEDLKKTKSVTISNELEVEILNKIK